ncbi:MAG TPA: hypothetical protein VHC01_01770 [Gaiellaceae bacterium]|nr:hypothetical protein [Gaiellaceae bacterium]
MATKFFTALQRRPVLLVALLVVAALVGGKVGGMHALGLWDGPI